MCVSVHVQLLYVHILATANEHCSSFVCIRACVCVMLIQTRESGAWARTA